MNKKLKLIIIFTIIILTTINITSANNTNTTNTDHLTQNTATPNQETQEIKTYTKQLKTNTAQQEINITQDNFNTYFNNYGELNYTKLSNNTTLQLTSIPSNTKELIIDADNELTRNINLEIIGSNNFTLNNTSLLIYTSFKNLKISNINFNYNEQYSQTYFLHIQRTNNNNENYCIKNIHINCTQNPRTSHNFFDEKTIYPLNIIGNNYQINNITIEANIPSSTIPYTGGDDKPHGIALNIEGNNITVKNSKITVNEKDKENPQTAYNTLYGVYHKGEGFTFTNNTINITATEYAYALIARSSQCNISNNNITTKSISYSAGINVEGTNIKNNIVQNNHINVTAGFREKDTTPTTAEDSAYALMLLDYSYKGSKYTPTTQSNNNTTFTNNTITGSAGNIYGIEIYGGINTQITNNQINITGRTPMGIGAIGENVSICDNNINTKGQTNNTEASADYLKPRTVGIYTYLSSTGINIENNQINTTNGRGIYIEQTNNTHITQNIINTTQYDYTIEITGTNNTINKNQLISRNHEADSSIRTTNQENHIQNNTNILPPPTQNTITLTTTQNQDNTITIKATIKTTNNTKINKGKITFKVKCDKQFSSPL